MAEKGGLAFAKRLQALAGLWRGQQTWPVASLRLRTGSHAPFPTNGLTSACREKKARRVSWCPSSACLGTVLSGASPALPPGFTETGI